MFTDPEQLENLRTALLHILQANASPTYGLGAPAIRAFLPQFGFTVSLADLAAELAYLRDKGLVACVPKLVSPANSAWRLTATGRDWLEGRA